jgi:hypothetical protein
LLKNVYLCGVMSITITPVARIRTEFPQKFGIPRQPLLAQSTVAEIVLSLSSAILTASEAWKSAAICG